MGVLRFSFVSDLLSGCLAQAPNTLLTSGGRQKGDEGPAPWLSSPSPLPSPRPPLPSSLSPSPHPPLHESRGLAVQGLGLASDEASLWTAVMSRISLWLPGCGLRRSASLSRLTVGVWMPVPWHDPERIQREIQ